MELRIDILSKTYPNGAGSIHLAELDMLTRKDELRRLPGYLPQGLGVQEVTARRCIASG
jgi:hypothetical protein